MNAPEAATLVLAGHGLVAAIVLPLVTGALLVVLEAARSRWVAPLSLASAAAGLALALALLRQADGGTVQAYLLGNWAAPFGIALALDRVAALLLVLTALVGGAALLHASGGEDRRGAWFHPLMQLQLMGLNGAFLTADLFNLFVFFEVLLAASYGLLLHGRGAGQRRRLGAGLHYVVFNLTGSALFLVAASLLYGVAGTLNLADLAQRLPALAPADARLALAAGLLLMVVFAVKAALLPLYFWLPAAYAAAGAPAAALFAVLTKVGVYAIARIATLMLPQALPLLLPLALATVALAAVGVLAAARLRALVAYLVVGSAGLLLVAVSLGGSAALGAGLFYLVDTTLAAAAWFLLADRLAARRGGSDTLSPQPLAGDALALGGGFALLALAAAGVPPLGGFLGKALLLQAAGSAAPATAGWVAPAVVAVVLLSSGALLVALSRAGVAVFWTAPRGPAAAPQPAVQRAAWALLAAALVAASVFAGPLARYTAAAAAQLADPRDYVAAVLGAEPVPPALRLREPAGAAPRERSP